MKRRLLCASFLLTLACGHAAVGAGAILSAQMAGPSFEVASVKPSKGPPVNESIAFRPGAFVATGATLRNLITVAYRIQSTRLVGATDFLSDRFDVIAKVPDKTPSSDLGLMLQALLADRFKLVAHRELREQPIYALVLARNDGRPGTELRESTSDCAPGTDIAAPTVGERPTCGMTLAGNRLRAGGVPMAAFSNFLSGVADRIVIDRTGLTGAYDFDLQYAPLNIATSELPSIYTALQEQLGLKLESTRGPVEMLVIDSVQKPTED